MVGSVVLQAQDSKHLKRIIESRTRVDALKEELVLRENALREKMIFKRNRKLQEQHQRELGRVYLTPNFYIHHHNPNSILKDKSNQVLGTEMGVPTLYIVLRTDVVGSLEAIVGAIRKMSRPELVKVRYISRGIGPPKPSELQVAEVSKGKMAKCDTLGKLKS